MTGLSVGLKLGREVTMKMANSAMSMQACGDLDTEEDTTWTMVRRLGYCHAVCTSSISEGTIRAWIIHKRLLVDL